MITNRVSGNEDAKRELEIVEKILPVLEEGRPARAANLTDDDRAILRGWFLLSTKPTIYAANVDQPKMTTLSVVMEKIQKDFSAEKIEKLSEAFTFFDLANGTGSFNFALRSLDSIASQIFAPTGFML